MNARTAVTRAQAMEAWGALPRIPVPMALQPAPPPPGDFGVSISPGVSCPLWRPHDAEGPLVLWSSGIYRSQTTLVIFLLTGP